MHVAINRRVSHPFPCQCHQSNLTRALQMSATRLPPHPSPGYGAFYWLIFLTLKNATIAVNMNYDREALESKRLKLLILWLALAVVFLASHALMYAFDRIAFLSAWMIALSFSMIVVGILGWLSVWQVSVILRVIV